MAPVVPALTAHRRFRAAPTGVTAETKVHGAERLGQAEGLEKKKGEEYRRKI